MIKRVAIGYDDVDIEALLTDLDELPISRRTVNKYRATLHAIFRFGLSPDQRRRWGIRENPVADTRKRRQEEIGHLEVFTVEQVEALARVAECGAWRQRRSYSAILTEHLRQEEDRQLADLLRVAADTGLRRGELVALRWEDVSWSERVRMVRRALSGTVERSTKSRRIRYVPLADQALAALDRLAQPPSFTGPSDYVFATLAGEAARPFRSSEALRRVSRRRQPSAAAIARSAAYRGQPAGSRHGPGQRQGLHGSRGPRDDRALPARGSRHSAD